MDDSKYIVVHEYDNKFGVSDFVPFVFPCFVPHDHFARQVGAVNGNIISAGFLTIGDDGTIEPYGGSISLGIKSSVADKRLLNKMFHTQYYIDNDF